YSGLSETVSFNSIFKARRFISQNETASCNAGMRCPLKSLRNLLPIFTLCNSLKWREDTRFRIPATLYRSGSCTTTGTPSAVNWTSNSIPSAFCLAASLNARIVFSKQTPEAPRCANTTGLDIKDFVDNFEDTFLRFIQQA